MERPHPPTTDRSPARSTDEADATARSAAIAALVHRMNGALNNASMACELALGDASSVDVEKTLRAGLAAIAQASRAAALIAHLSNGRGMPNDSNAAYASDVREILREELRKTGQALSPELDDPACDAEKAADLLVSELARRPNGDSRS